MGGRHGATTRVLLADDHGLMRSVMAMAVRSMAGFEVVGQANNGRDAVEAAERLRPDLVVMDIQTTRIYLFFGCRGARWDVQRERARASSETRPRSVKYRLGRPRSTAGS